MYGYSRSLKLERIAESSVSIIAYSYAGVFAARTLRMSSSDVIDMVWGGNGTHSYMSTLAYDSTPSTYQWPPCSGT